MPHDELFCGRLGQHLDRVPLGVESALADVAEGVLATEDTRPEALGISIKLSKGSASWAGLNVREPITLTFLRQEATRGNTRQVSAEPVGPGGRELLAPICFSAVPRQVRWSAPAGRSEAPSARMRRSNPSAPRLPQRTSRLTVPKRAGSWNPGHRPPGTRPPSVELPGGTRGSAASRVLRSSASPADEVLSASQTSSVGAPSQIMDRCNRSASLVPSGEMLHPPTRFELQCYIQVSNLPVWVATARRITVEPRSERVNLTDNGTRLHRRSLSRNDGQRRSASLLCPFRPPAAFPV